MDDLEERWIVVAMMRFAVGNLGHIEIDDDSNHSDDRYGGIDVDYNEFVGDNDDVIDVVAAGGGGDGADAVIDCTALTYVLALYVF